MRGAATLLAVAGLIAPATAQQTPPLPPPPLAPDRGGTAPDVALQALNGEWKLDHVDGRRVTSRYPLTLWGTAFAAGQGCRVAQGQLRPLGAGRYRVERYGPTPANCAALVPPEPFNRSELHLGGGRSGLAVTDAEGRRWVFAWSDPARTMVSDDFLRGEWLLANERGSPFRGVELTRVSFDDHGYGVQAANCSFQTDGWVAERNWAVRPSGSQYVQTVNCRPRSLGDRLARAGDKAAIIAEPVENRLRVTVDGRSAWLVPAARFPELSPGARSFPVNGWVRQLADVAALLPPSGRADLLTRVLPNGDALVGAGDKAMATAFSGYSIAELDRLAHAGLPTDGIARSLEERSFEELMLSTPLVSVAELEAIEPVDRGDGLGLDYRYRVLESWRGGKRQGDLLIVRMPPLMGKSRSPLITPEQGARVLLLASRSAYLASTLRDGKPPSTDRRVVAMTLPLLRVVGGKLVEARPGANVLGSARFAGMSIAEAKAKARAVDERITAALSDLQKQRRFRYFVTHVGARALPDPTRFWVDYGPDLQRSPRRGAGAVIAWSDGCVHRTGRSYGSAPPARSCPRGEVPVEPAVGRAAVWIDAHGMPEAASIGDPVEPLAPIIVPTTPAVTLRSAVY